MILDYNHVEILLARREFWRYCQKMYPDFYADDIKYLKELCDTLEWFYRESDRHILIICLPPRHGKSLTAGNFVEWVLGQDPTLPIMTASYNEILSSTFSRKVRDTIGTAKVGDELVYSDIFPNTKLEYGNSGVNLWQTTASRVPNYIATSPTGTATGFGAKLLLIDDIIKSAEEAYNEASLDKSWLWYNNTAQQRLEHGGKTIVIMTRWAEGDLAGRLLQAYPKDIVLFKRKAVLDYAKKEMLAPKILSFEDFKRKTQEMNPDIVEANFNQTPIDVKGRLYTNFKEWENLPASSDGQVWNYTDTADTGTDFLCSVNYIINNNEAYITDLVFTQEPMETTENMVADLYVRGNTTKAIIESNNGGRGFARNVKTKLNDRGWNQTRINTVAQTKNKESRILTSSGWVEEHVYMPLNWRRKYPEFANQVLKYQRKGKNAHDDALDVLASIYEHVCGKIKPTIANKSGLLGTTRVRQNYWR